MKVSAAAPVAAHSSRMKVSAAAPVAAHSSGMKVSAAAPVAAQGREALKQIDRYRQA